MAAQKVSMLYCPSQEAVNANSVYTTDEPPPLPLLYLSKLPANAITLPLTPNPIKPRATLITALKKLIQCTSTQHKQTTTQTNILCANITFILRLTTIPNHFPLNS